MEYRIQTKNEMQKIKNSKFKIPYSNNGFTLIEVLIYVSIFAIIGGFLVDVLVNTLQINIESQSSRAVTEQGRFIVETVKRLVRDSSLIDMSTTTSQNTLVLRMNDYAGNRDFIHVYASGTRMYMAEGIIDNDSRASSTPCSLNSPACAINALTDDKISVDSLSFTRLSNAPGQDSLQIDFTLSYATTKKQAMFNKAFRTSIARVSAAVFDSDLIPNGSNKNVGVSGQKWTDGYFSGNLYTNSITVGPATPYFRVLSDSGFVGIGVSSPSHELQVVGDIYASKASSSLILKSSGGNCWAIRVTDSGGLATTSVAC